MRKLKLKVFLFVLTTFNLIACSQVASDTELPDFIKSDTIVENVNIYEVVHYSSLGGQEPVEKGKSPIYLIIYRTPDAAKVKCICGKEILYSGTYGRFFPEMVDDDEGGHYEDNWGIYIPDTKGRITIENFDGNNGKITKIKINDNTGDKFEKVFLQCKKISENSNQLSDLAKPDTIIVIPFVYEVNYYASTEKQYTVEAPVEKDKSSIYLIFYVTHHAAKIECICGKEVLYSTNYYEPMVQNYEKNNTWNILNSITRVQWERAMWRKIDKNTIGVELGTEYNNGKFQDVYLECKKVSEKGFFDIY